MYNEIFFLVKESIENMIETKRHTKIEAEKPFPSKLQLKKKQMLLHVCMLVVLP